MKSVSKIIFRNLTQADFFNINKPRGTEKSGGGQAYIDFSTKTISSDQWIDFFKNIKNVTRTKVTKGLSWEFPIYSIGIDDGKTAQQQLKIYQRRNASISITSQKIHSNRSNRVNAWHPENGFPKPIDNTDRNQCPIGLMVYLASTYCGQVWAGWYLNDGTTQIPLKGNNQLLFGEMFNPDFVRKGYSGLLTFNKNIVFLNIDDIEHPFHTKETINIENTKHEYKKEKQNDSTSNTETLFDEDLKNNKTDVSEYVIKVRKRNSRLVKKLKSLYENKCQITGAEYIFQKKDGVGYTEAHHLIPLGEGGFDDPRNLVVLSPQIHKMLHYADVSTINLEDILHMEDGSALLELTINKKCYTIQWHPEHAKLFK